MANMAFVSGISFWSYGLYIGPLEDEFGWSRAEASLGISFALLFGGLLKLSMEYSEMIWHREAIRATWVTLTQS